MSELESWSAIKLARSAPKGSLEALESAKKVLAPFELDHRDDLLHLCTCEKCIEKFIVDIATRFNAFKLRIESAPRKKIVIENLERVAEAARNLAYALGDLDDYSREYLVVLDEIDEVYFWRAYDAAAASKLPKPATEEEAASDGTFVETLLALDSYVSRRLRHLVGGTESGAAVDKGGNTNVLKHKFGPPAAYLVHWCWAAFENCKPGQATASENGPFVTFVNLVHEYATGNIEENQTLLNWIKKLIKLLRKHYLLLRKFSHLEDDLEALKAEPTTEESVARIVELEAEVERVKHETVEALLATGPTNLRFKQGTEQAMIGFKT
jgi:hypothetical protein